MDLGRSCCGIVEAVRFDMARAKRWKLIFEKGCRLGIYLRLEIEDQVLVSYDRSLMILGMAQVSSGHNRMNLGKVLGNCGRNLMMGSRVLQDPSQQKECDDLHQVLVHRNLMMESHVPLVPSQRKERDGLH